MVHIRVQRQWQYCARCNQLMFEYFVSPDGHFGLVSEPGSEQARRKHEISCAACGAIYELLDKVDATGQPVVRKFRGA
jgi:5-methylcytosine-specific restriction endonuclease McrA